MGAEGFDRVSRRVGFGLGLCELDLGLGELDLGLDLFILAGLGDLIVLLLRRDGLGPDSLGLDSLGLDGLGANRRGGLGLGLDDRFRRGLSRGDGFRGRLRRVLGRCQLLGRLLGSVLLGVLLVAGFFQVDQRLVPNRESVDGVVELVVPVLGTLLVLLLGLHRSLVQELLLGGDVRGGSGRGLAGETFELLEFGLFLFGELEVLVGVFVLLGEVRQRLLVALVRGPRVEGGGCGLGVARHHLLGFLRGVHRGIFPFLGSIFASVCHGGERVHHLLLLVEEYVVLLARDVFGRVDLSVDGPLGVLVVE